MVVAEVEGNLVNDTCTLLTDKDEFGCWKYKHEFTIFDVLELHKIVEGETFRADSLYKQPCGTFTARLDDTILEHVT